MFNLLNWDLLNFSHSICIAVHFLLLTSTNISKEAFFWLMLPLSLALCYKQQQQFKKPPCLDTQDSTLS